MANRIISFGTTENLLDSTTQVLSSSLSSLEVYNDISMDSVFTNSLSADKQVLIEDQFSTMSGWSWKVQNNVNVKAIFDSLRNIFTWNRGERILLPEFGSRLHTLLYEGITPATEEAIMAEIRMCVSEWEPRISIVRVVNASNVDDTEDNVIHIQVVFTIPALSDEQYSYSFSYTKGT